MTARHGIPRRPSRPLRRPLSAALGCLRLSTVPTVPTAARGALYALVVALAAGGGLFLHDHAPGLYVLFLLVALGFVVALIRDQIRRDRAFYDKENKS